MLSRTTGWFCQTVPKNWTAETDAGIRRLAGLASQSLHMKCRGGRRELRHFFTNWRRDLSLEMWVEARAGIEPACKDLQSSA